MRLIPRTCVILLGAGLGLLPASMAVSGPYTDVASAFDPGDGFDLTMSIDYGFDIQRAAVKRELSGFPGTGPDDPLPLVKDLVFKGARHTLTPRMELGIFTDLSLSVALPLILSQSRSLSLDQRDTPCVFPGGTEEPTCINRDNSTTVGDALLPPTGFDANNPGGAGFADGALLFRGPNRAGIDQVHLGMTWAPMNQARDDTKPTWKLGAEARLAVGAPMRLDVANPGSSTSVGRGVNEVRLWTSIAKNFGWAEPFVEMWWVAPYSVTSDSAFADLGFGQERSASQQRAGTYFGFEAIALDQPEKKRRVSIDIGARLESNFEGRGYSEMWEVFQYAGQNLGDPLYLDADPVTDGVQDLQYPGVSRIENHLSYGGRIGVRAEIGDMVQIGAAFKLIATQAHVITFADAGDDLPTCDAMITVDCEVDNNVLVNPGTPEVNPGYVPLVDQVGRRYHADEIADYSVLFDARFLF